MSKQILFIPGLFALGILTGIAMMHFTADEAATDVDASEAPRSVPSPFVEVSAPQSDLAEIYRQLDALSSRLQVLEAVIDERADSSADETPRVAASNNNTAQPQMASANRSLSTEKLVNAGLESSIAEDIVRRKNQLELDKLELRDAAVRGGYLGSERYMDELQALMDEDVSLREELGDDLYDRYLFNNGQMNRIRVASVMAGSAAEQSGVSANDIVLTYDQQRMFEYTELQQATTQGDREEFVSMMVERDGQDLMLWVPRGPLGVRLTMTRVDPER